MKPQLKLIEHEYATFLKASVEIICKLKTLR